jgi:CheY-like chemotaxis protein
MDDWIRQDKEPTRAERIGPRTADGKGNRRNLNRAAPDFSAMRILVVEDDALVRTMAVESLADEGFEVIEAETGEQAVDRCQNNAPDVVFTDIRLPGQLTGWDVAERCREADPSVPVIYATGHSPVHPRPVHGSICFYKPYTPQQLLDAIHQLCSP